MGRHSTGGTAPILSFPQAGSKDKRGGESLKKEKTIRKIRRKRGEKKGGSSSNMIGQKLSWTARGWKGFQHQILKGSPCIAKALPRVLINPIQVSMA